MIHRFIRKHSWLNKLFILINYLLPAGYVLHNQLPFNQQPASTCCNVANATSKFIALLIELKLWFISHRQNGKITKSKKCVPFIFRLNRMLVITCVVALNGIIFAAYPWCSTFPAMLAISFVSNVFSGGVNCCK